MVSTPGPAWRLDAETRGLGAQIEASFALWLRSAGPCLPFSLMYSLAGLLPLLALGDTGARVLKVAANIVVYAFDPDFPEPAEDLAQLTQAMLDWATSPLTLALAGLALLLALYGVTGVMLRQRRIAAGADRGFADAALTALKHLPAAFASWVLYTLILLACTLLLIGFWALLMVWAFDAGGAGLLGVLLLFLVGSLLLSVPLVWTSVAFGYAPVLAAIDGRGPLATHAASLRRVRGHWARAATLMTVPMLVYFGVGGSVSSMIYVLLGLIVVSVGGLGALLEGSWLGWGQWLAAVPLAFGFPLAFAGFIVALKTLPVANYTERPV